MSSTEKTITLITADGKTFDVSDAAAAAKFGTIKNMIDDGLTETDKRVEIPAVTGEICAMIVDWLQKHSADEAATAEELKQWDAEFVKRLDQRVLYELLLAADFLEARELVEILTEKTASMIRGKTAEEIRRVFNIKNDFTPEQEAEMRRKNAWAFDR